MVKKVNYNSPVILSFFFLSLFSLILGYFTNGTSTRLLFTTYRAPLLDPLMYIRLVTHVLGHANVEHFFSNMLIILLVGPILEEKYGSLVLFYLIVATALITGLFNNIFFTTGLLGASGVAFMFIILVSFVNVKEGTIPLTLILVSVMYIGQEIYQGVIDESNISRITHILGGFLGGIFGFLLNNRRIYDKNRN